MGEEKIVLSKSAYNQIFGRTMAELKEEFERETPIWERQCQAFWDECMAETKAALLKCNYE